MKKESILEIMSYIDPTLIEQADLGQKKPPFRAVKIALIAAAICLTLMGTAFAINSFFGLTVKIEPEESGTVYEINWSITKFSLDMFSDQLLQASEKRGTQAVVTKQFDTWLDTQNFLGSSFVCTWPEINGWTAPYYMYLYHTEYDCLWGVQVESIDIGLQASISMELYTENFWQDESITSSRGFTDESVLERLDPYPMSNGTTAEILKVTDLLPSVPNPDTDDAAAVDPSAGQPETRNSTTYVGNFVKDGILYTVRTFGGLPKSDEEKLNLLRELLDSFAYNSVSQPEDVDLRFSFDAPDTAVFVLGPQEGVFPWGLALDAEPIPKYPAMDGFGPCYEVKLDTVTLDYNVLPDSGIESLYRMTTESPVVSTDRGVSVGDSLARVKELYPDSVPLDWYSESGIVYVWEPGGDAYCKHIAFFAQNDVLTSIEIENLMDGRLLE